MKVPSKLKDTLEDPTERPVGTKKKDIWRLVKQLQFRRRLQQLRNTSGAILTDPESIAKEITTYVPPTQLGATDKCNGKFARAQKVELLQPPPAVAHHGPVHGYR